jgi:hypothetical protein
VPAIVTRGQLARFIVQRYLLRGPTKCLAHYAESNDHPAMLSVSSDHLDNIVCCQFPPFFSSGSCPRSRPTPRLILVLLSLTMALDLHTIDCPTKLTHMQHKTTNFLVGNLTLVSLCQYRKSNHANRITTGTQVALDPLLPSQCSHR